MRPRIQKRNDAPAHHTQYTVSVLGAKYAIIHEIIIDIIHGMMSFFIYKIRIVLVP